MSKKWMTILAMTLCLGAGPALARQHSGMPQLEPVPAPPEPGAIALYPGLKPKGPPETWYKAGGTYIVRNVTQPTLTPVLPDPAKATGAAVIVAPGGAYMILSLDHEGWKMARRLADQGIAAFVLKYRTSETPVDEKAFGAFAQQRGAQIAKDVAAGVQSIPDPGATEDALAAVKMVRDNAAKWGVDPNRVGMVGFSAGAVTAIKVGVSPVAAARPNFIAPFYPSLAPEVVPADAPPMFLAIAFNDALFGKQKLGIVEAWRAAGRPVEFHGYETGGHGFGFGMPNTTTPLVFDQLMVWMKARGYLKPSVTAAAAK